MAVSVTRSGCPNCGRAEVSESCPCGLDWSGEFATITAHLNGEQWQMLFEALLCRSGGSCEVRSPACLAGAGGSLLGMPRERVSIHHRKPRGAGGTSLADINDLCNLLLICGTGTTGCHGFIERERVWARLRGFIVPRGRHGVITAMTDPAQVPLVLRSGRRVLLHRTEPLLLPPPDGIPYALEL